MDEVEVIVVANGCTDNTKEYVEYLGDLCTFVWSDKALGYAKATNLGLRASKGEYLLLLNNDTVVQDKSWLDLLLAPFSDPKVGVVGPIMHTEVGIDFIIGFCLMTTRQMVETEVGYLDEDFEIGGMEDVDFCYRVKLAGYEIRTTDGQRRSNFPLIHYGERTVWHLDIGREAWDHNFYKNQKKLAKKWGLKFEEKIKLNLGCGDMILPGWVNCDLYYAKADLQCDVKKLPFEDSSVDEIYSSHVIEHFDFMEGQEVLREWRRVLKPGGIITIECPELLSLCKRFVEADEQTRIGLYVQFYGYPWKPGQAHKFLYTENQLRWTMDQIGFKNIQRYPAKRYIDLESTCIKMVGMK